MNFSLPFRFKSVRKSLAVLLLTGLAASLARAADTVGAEGPATIHLANGSYAAGKLVAYAGGDELVWQSPSFTSPFIFPLDAVNVVHFPVPESFPQPTGDYCFELAGGDILFGDLLSLDDEHAVIEIGGLGQLHVERRVLRRMFRWSGGKDLLYFGPSGLAGWQFVGNPVWREEAGHLLADQRGAIRRDFQAPPRACFEFEISWTKQADFELALGVGADATAALRAFRFEIWENQLVAQRETEREADVAAIQDVKTGPGRIHVIAFLDQARGRLLVFSSGGQKLAELAVSTARPQSFGGLQLTNRAGDVRLERLRISRWDGAAPRLADAGKARIHASDGSIIYGQLKSYDAAKKEFVLATGAAEKRLPAVDVPDAFFPADGVVAARKLRAVHLSGIRLSGELAKVDERGVWINCPGIAEPVVSPFEALHALTALLHRGDAPPFSGRQGRLEVAGAQLRGSLIDAQEGDGSCLVWQPTASKAASSIARGVSARIIYRDPPSPVPAQPARSGRVIRAAPMLQRRVALGRATNTSTSPLRAFSSGQSVLHLRSGDTFQCTVASINEKGVNLKSVLTDATFVPGAAIKVLELLPDTAAVTITSPKKERLLTLPRMQRDNPPTQLIRSTGGDYLRGRLVAMNEKELTVEVRLETKMVPRATVARIIWLHADEIDAAATPPVEPSAVTRVQALPADGNRLTFFAEKVEGSTLSGKSELLGTCRVDLQTIDQLLVGAAIEQTAAKLAFHQWKLKPALDPLAAEEGEPGDSEGLASVLVGKPAPAFELELLDGGNFQLADQKGQLIVLDFWASWCGPCLQVMPQVDMVVREFAADNVRLVSVNQQETPERIRTVLDRLGLKIAVALDREGLVAERYGAITIPQTVIIDREGKVARVFASTSARFDEQFRAALQGVVAGPAAAD